MTIYNFKPTYLMIKQHEITGLKYLCKTIGKDPIKYKGSGTHWKSHIKKYGTKFVKTLWYKLYADIDELRNVAIALSDMYDVVDSSEWANLKPENGLDGGDSEYATINNNNLVKQNRHPWQRKNGDSVGKRNNIQKVYDGTHQFLKRDDGSSVSSDFYNTLTQERKETIHLKKRATCLEKYGSEYALQNKEIAASEGLKKHQKSLHRFGVNTDEELYNNILIIAKTYNLYRNNNEPNLSIIADKYFSYYGRGAYQFLWKCYNSLKPS